MGDSNIRLNLECGLIENTSKPTPDKSTRVTFSVIRAALVDEMYGDNDLCNVSGVLIFDNLSISFLSLIRFTESSSKSANTFVNVDERDCCVLTFMSVIVSELRTLSTSVSVITDTFSALVLNQYFG